MFERLSKRPLRHRALACLQRGARLAGRAAAGQQREESEHAEELRAVTAGSRQPMKDHVFES
jgi:hypothetical protein